MSKHLIIPLLIFFIVANPATYKMTRKVLGSIASPDGLPSQMGVAVHAVVFVILAKFIMRRVSGYTFGGTPASDSMSMFHVTGGETQGTNMKYNVKS
jgi:hypothetical protein